MWGFENVGMMASGQLNLEREALHFDKLSGRLNAKH